ncbi:MAG: 30S ribosomal protein S1 [Lentisphaerae bacterium]|nr:30S ribosomal protein S1 [Lentisphaerota bacterium]
MTTETKRKKQIDFNLAQFGGDDRDAMLKMYEETIKDFKEGSIVKGEILAVKNDEVLVDIGYKSEGVVSVSEFGSRDDITIGDEIEVLLLEIEDEDGNVVLSKEEAEQKRMWDNVLSSCEEGNVIEGKICSRVKGGLIVDINGVKAFLPGSQVDVIPVRNVTDLMNEPLEFKIMKINKERRNIVLSRRDLIEERLRNKKRELLSQIEKGQVRPGIVKNITDFGAFVDLGGLDGLLHITDMSWGRISHPSKMLKVGDEINVCILDIDFEKERVSLGLKQKSQNPWDDIDEKFPVGSRIHGKVVNLVAYGAFVELVEGVEGLVHVSEISWVQRVAKAADVLSVGDMVDAVVLNINKADQKISLGMRQTEANPWELAKEHYPVGSNIEGVVRNFTSYGAFVELQDGIDGMIHVSDMSWTKKINHPSEMLKKGEAVQVVVLEVDSENQRISLGLKQAQPDPWAAVASKYEVGQIVKGTVSKLASFGAFVELEEGIDGLVHISQISEEHVEKTRDALKVGDEVEARIVKLDSIERRIGLSIKAVTQPDTEFDAMQDTIIALKPGEDLVDLAGAFDEAFGMGEQEWRPGQDKEESQVETPDAEEEAPEATEDN